MDPKIDSDGLRIRGSAFGGNEPILASSLVWGSQKSGPCTGVLPKFCAPLHLFTYVQLTPSDPGCCRDTLPCLTERCHKKFVRNGWGSCKEHAVASKFLTVPIAESPPLLGDPAQNTQVATYNVPLWLALAAHTDAKSLGTPNGTLVNGKKD